MATSVPSLNIKLGISFTFHVDNKLKCSTRCSRNNDLSILVVGRRGNSISTGRKKEMRRKKRNNWINKKEERKDKLIKKKENKTKLKIVL